MRLRFVAVLVLLASASSACPTRIKRVEIPTEDRMTARRLMLEGDALIREGKDHLSLLKYLESSTLDPYSHHCFNKLAVAYARVLMFSQARRAIDRAIQLNPDYSHAYNTRGIIQMGLGKPGAAAHSFEKALERSPESPVFHLNLGRAHLEAGHYRKSRAAIARALELDPGVLEIEDKIEISAAKRRDDPESYYRMARVFGEVGDERGCLNYLAKAFESGFRDRDRLLQDRAFEAFRGSPAFTELLSSYGLQD